MIKRKILPPLFFLVFFLSALACAALADNAPPSADPPQPVDRYQAKVAGVVFDYPGKLPPDVYQLVEVKKGGPLSPRLIRDSIKLLYLKGLFKNIIAEGQNTPQGTVVTFRLIPKIRITRVKINGNKELPGKKIIARMALKEGDFIEPQRLKETNDAVLRLYRDNGFPQAKVRIEPKETSPLTGELLVDIEEGAPTIISGVSFTGGPVLPEKELVKIAAKVGIKPGGRLIKNNLDNAVTRLTDYYVKKDYVKADVEQRVTVSSGAAAAGFRINAGPKLEVKFDGNRKLSRKELNKVLTFWEDRDVSEDSVSENLDKLQKYYKKEGFYFVQVKSTMEESAAPPKVKVTFSIKEGPRATLEHVYLRGNKVLKTDLIKKSMALHGSGIIIKERVTDEAIKQDAERIRSLYESEGFLKARIKPEPIKFYDKDTRADVTFDIAEGPRTYVLSRRIIDGEGVPGKKVEAAIKQKVGEPFDPQRIKEDENNMISLFSNAGYTGATIDTGREFVDGGRGVKLSYVISQGSPVKVGRIILRGNVATKDRTVLREMLVKTGDPFDYEKILMSQQRIYRLGFFSQVRIKPVDPEKVESSKDLLVTVRERDAGRVEFGAGYGDWDRLRGFAQVGYINLFGLGHSISLRGDASFKETKAIATYKWPWFMGLNLNYRTSLVYLDADKPNYHIRDLIGITGFDKTFGKHVTSSLNYQYEKIKFGDIKAGAALAPEDKNKSNLASISPSIVFDFRDNPFNPTKGSVHALILKYASTFFGSTVNMLKATAQTSWYYPLYNGIIGGFSARGGIESSLGGALKIPISERFFIGGASSLRGYSYESVAPLNRFGNPVGGDSMAIFNVEVRFPLPYNFGLVTFLDAGNAWLLNKNILAGGAPGRTDLITRTGTGLEQSGTNGLRYGAGLGIRYETPVGPLRLDYGFKLNRRPGESAGELHFTLGQAF
ncbi:MAG: outer membrane protein assembly factor BamA [Nitrospirota bacterium]